MASQIIDAEFVDIPSDDGYPNAGPRVARERKRKQVRPTRVTAKEKQNHANTREVSSDSFGRLDLLVSKGIKQIVLNTGDPAVFALYGRFGSMIDELAKRYLGPIGIGMGKR